MVTMKLHPCPSDGSGGNRGSRSKSPARHKVSAQKSEEESKNSSSNHPKRKGTKYGFPIVALKQQTKIVRETKAEDD
eukprot:276270-Ditylum_brightwellii.AAC.1